MKSITIIFITFFSASICFAAEPPDGLFGMKWGETLCQCVDKGICKGQTRRREKGTEFIVRKPYFLKHIEFIPVFYVFDKSDCGLILGGAHFMGDENFKYLIKLLTGKYGKPRVIYKKDAFGKKTPASLRWNFPRTSIVLGYDTVWNKGKMFYFLTNVFKKAPEF